MDMQTGIIKRIIRKFKNAFRGLLVATFYDRSIQTQLGLMVVAIIYFLFLKITLNEWMWVILAIVLVVVFEFINSCFEQLCNVISKEYNEDIKNIKDLGAAFVLLGAVFAIIVAVVITLAHL